MRRDAAVLLAALALAGPAAGQAPPAPALPQDAAPGVTLSGAVRTGRTLTLAELRAMPGVTVEVPMDAAAAGAEAGGTAAGPRRIAYTGVPVWALLQEAGPVDEPGRATQFRHVLLAQGRDGYAVAVAFGEMDPRLEGKQVLVATAQDGQPLPAPRLVVPGDRHGGRAVRDLVRIDVR